MSTLFDPYAATNTERSDDELELFLLFCICVAGKKATTISRALDRLLSISPSSGSPFQKILALDSVPGGLRAALKESRMGKYGLLERALPMIAKSGMDLRTCSGDDLMKIPGIGFKTSRFFILHSRKGADVAVIDTHILKYLRDIGIDNVPTIVPNTHAKYERLEKIMLSESHRSGMTPAAFDLAIWTWYSRGNTGRPKGIGHHHAS